MKRKISQKDYRQIQIGLLDAIHNFCVSNSLRYSLGGGTLLGAIRHKGFIPWDDDVDIMMPRPDYEYFLLHFKHDYIKIQNPEKDENTYIPFAKVYDDRTILIEYYAINGVFVDLFPIDGLPSRDKLNDYLKIQNQAITYLYKIHDYHNGLYYNYEPKKNRLFVRIKYWIKHLFYPSKNKCFRILNDLHNRYDFETSSFAGAICGAYGEKEYMEKRVFEKYIPLKFENKEYMCISEFDSYLSKHYGNYMQLPPEKDRIGGHNFEVYWR